MTRKISLPVMAALPPALLKEVHEHDLQLAVWRYAEMQGWRCHYTARSAFRLQDGSYRGTATPGWPDVIAIRAGVMWAIELKSEVGRVRPEQREWMALLADVPGVNTAIWRPRDAQAAIEALR